MTVRGNGFTLAELLVGLLIFGLLATAGTLLLAGAGTSAGQSRARLDDVAALARTRLLLADDLAQAVARPWRDAAGGRHPAFQGDANGFTMVRAGAASPGLLRLHWAAGTQLARSIAPMLDGTGDGETARLLAVRAAHWRYHDGRNWHDAWPVAGQPQGLPVAVAVELDLPQGPARLLLAVAPARGAS